VNDGMRPVAVFVEKPSEGVLHGARGGGENMGFHGGQMYDVLADEPFGYRETVRINVVEAQELAGEFPHGVANVEPLFAFVKVDVAQAVGVEYVNLLIFAFAQVSVDHHRPVVAAVDQFLFVSVFQHGVDDAVQLPGRGRASRKKEVPGDVDLERRVRVLRDDVLVSGEVEHAMVIRADGLRARLHHRHFRCRHVLTRSSLDISAKAGALGLPRGGGLVPCKRLSAKLLAQPQLDCGGGLNHAERERLGQEEVHHFGVVAGIPDREVGSYRHLEIATAR